MKAAKNLGAKIWGGVLVTICLLAVSTSARAQVSANPQVVNFGTQSVGSQSATTDIVLTNNSRRYVRIYGASLSGSAFSYSGPDGYLVLSPYQSVKGSVSFRPGSAQTFSGALTFNGPYGLSVTVSLFGTGASSNTSDTTNTQTSATRTTYRSRHSRHSWNGGSSNNTPDPVTSDPTPTSDPVVPDPVVAPSIITQPVSRTVTAGQTASFAIGASGDSLSYQWRKNGAAISGATSPSYTTPASSTSDNGAKFTCTVSNSAATLTSDAATLTVTAATVAPSITSQPASRSVTAGQTASFSVSVSGTAPFTYQWTRNGAAIGGAISSTYTTPATTSADNGAQFAVIVSNAAGNVTSSSATLTVGSVTLSLSSNPSSLSFGSVDVGATATKQVTLTNSGNGNLTLSGLSMSGAGFNASGVSSGQVLTPGQTASINVTFAPSAGGNASGQVTVSSNAAPVIVNLSGSGLQQVSRSVALSWTRSTSTVVGYMVYSSQVSGGPYTRLTGTAVSVPNYTDSSVQNGKTYYYVVTAVDGKGVESNYSNQASANIQ